MLLDFWTDVAVSSEMYIRIFAVTFQPTPDHPIANTSRNVAKPQHHQLISHHRAVSHHRELQEQHYFSMASSGFLAAASHTIVAAA